MGSALLTVTDAYFGDGVKYLEALQSFMVNVAELLGANKDTAAKDMKDCLDFEVELHKVCIFLSVFYLFFFLKIYLI